MPTRKTAPRATRKTAPRATGNGKATLTYEQLRALKKPNARLVPIVLDSDLVIALQDARTALESARTMREDLEPRRQALIVAQRELDEATYWWRLEAVSAHTYRKLVEKHAPTQEQLDRAEAEGDSPPTVDPTAFYPALLAACCVDPKLTEEEARALWAEGSRLSGGELTGLTTAAILVCSEPSVSQLR